MKATFSEDNGLTIARIMRQAGVKPTEFKVQLVMERLRQLYNFNFEQDIIDALKEDEDVN